MADFTRHIEIDTLWQSIQSQAQAVADEFTLLADFYHRSILQHSDYQAALAYVLAEKISDNPDNILLWQHTFLDAMQAAPNIYQAALADLLCQLKSNASIKDNYTPLLYFGGNQALQCHRFAHYFWHHGKAALALFIQGRMVSLFGVDIHPGAVIGKGIFIDHAVGIVIGETAVVEDEVTLFQSVTLGGTGKGTGDRHPKVRKGAFIGAGTQVFGNIEIGRYAKVAGGTVVVKPVAANTTVVGTVAQPLTQSRVYKD